MDPRWLIRMSQWARNPPPAWKVKLVLGVIAAALLIAGYEALFGWPEALTPQGLGRRPGP